MHRIAPALALALALVLFAARPLPAQDGELLVAFHVDGPVKTLTEQGVSFDPDTSADGKGSLRIENDTPRIVSLFTTGDVDAQDAVLHYSAAVNTEGFSGRVYLEMWCIFEELGSFYSRGLHSAVSGGAGWTRTSTPFTLEPGQNPVNVQLDIVVEGKGVIYVDDIRLTKQGR